MINTQGKILTLLFSAFIVILLGVVLIQPIADDIETVKASSYDIINESVTLSVTTRDIANETHTLVANETTLSNNYLTALTGLRNITSEDITGYCNITLITGALKCNETFDATIYADYTYNDFSTGTLAHDELASFDACRNSTMTAILAGTNCNVTLINGAVKVTYDNFTDDLAYIDYKYDTDTYVRSGAARTLLTLIILLFAIAILTVGVGFAIAAFKQSGVM